MITSSQHLAPALGLKVQIFISTRVQNRKVIVVVAIVFLSKMRLLCATRLYISFQRSYNHENNNAFVAFFYYFEPDENDTQKRWFASSSVFIVSHLTRTTMHILLKEATRKAISLSSVE